MKRKYELECPICTSTVIVEVDDRNVSILDEDCDHLDTDDVMKHIVLEAVERYDNEEKDLIYSSMGGEDVSP